ncbi:hypothetical protein COB52_02690 [Candidatus Kaiserbacteria bacterium]|nr:MAG: hypothetical protein COB52_02690 [Candidatus Kaiserbacteria bacterium]
MKLLIVRHGESTDDLTDQYGGWADFHLTDKGKEQLSESATKIDNLNVKFTKVMCSPLLRAQESAEIISTKLGIPLEVFHYAKERNAYGILSGLNKDEAITLYPEFANVNIKTDFIPGKERSEDFGDRVRAAFSKIKELDTDVVLVTHGGFTARFFQIFLDIETTKVGDGGFALFEINGENIEILEADGIEY